MKAKIWKQPAVNRWMDKEVRYVPMKVKAKVAQSCPTFCDPMDYTVHGILQVRILVWVAVPFFRGSSQPRDWTQVFCSAGRFFTSWATREAIYIYKNVCIYIYKTHVLYIYKNKHICLSWFISPCHRAKHFASEMNILGIVIYLNMLVHRDVPYKDKCDWVFLTRISISDSS